MNKTSSRKIVAKMISVIIAVALALTVIVAVPLVGVNAANEAPASAVEVNTEADLIANLTASGSANIKLGSDITLTAPITAAGTKNIYLENHTLTYAPQPDSTTSAIKGTVNLYNLDNSTNTAFVNNSSATTMFNLVSWGRTISGKFVGDLSFGGTFTTLSNVVVTGNLFVNTYSAITGKSTVEGNVRATNYLLLGSNAADVINLRGDVLCDNGGYGGNYKSFCAVKGNITVDGIVTVKKDGNGSYMGLSVAKDANIVFNDDVHYISGGSSYSGSFDVAGNATFNKNIVSDSLDRMSLGSGIYNGTVSQNATDASSSLSISGGTFNKNISTAKAPTITGGTYKSTISIKSGQSFTVPESVILDEGTYSGLYDADGTNYAPGATVPTGTYYFKTVTLPTATFTGFTGDDTTESGSTVTMPDDKTPDNGGQLVGWKDASDKIYSPGAEVEITENTTFTAVGLNLTMSTGAGIRWAKSHDDRGIRFQTNIKKADLEALAAAGATTTTGTLIAPYTSSVTDASFTVDGVTALDGQNVVNTGNSLYKTNDYFYGGIKGMCIQTNPAQQGQHEDSSKVVTTKLAARGYVSVTYSDGTKKVFYTAFSSTDNVRSMQQIANAALADTTITYSQIQKDILTTQYGAAAIAGDYIKESGEDANVQ